ncbi:MAG: hypothetical protein Q7J57_04060, partial [Gemmobacter sp.]|nr:hypothetical protein [Gemmobacter sp.]
EVEVLLEAVEDDAGQIKLSKRKADRIRAWDRIAQDLPMHLLESMIHPATLSDLPALGADILKGQVQGRVVVDVNA